MSVMWWILFYLFPYTMFYNKMCSVESYLITQGCICLLIEFKMGIANLLVVFVRRYAYYIFFIYLSFKDWSISFKAMEYIFCEKLLDALYTYILNKQCKYFN